MSIWKKYGYAWITGLLFIISLIGQWILGWNSYVSDQIEHQATIQVSDFFFQMGRDTLENWQSEFLQLIWQVTGLSFLLYAGSPQSKDNSDRQERKIDQIIKILNQKDRENSKRKIV